MYNKKQPTTENSEKSLNLTPKSSWRIIVKKIRKRSNFKVNVTLNLTKKITIYTYKKYNINSKKKALTRLIRSDDRSTKFTREATQKIKKRTNLFYRRRLIQIRDRHDYCRSIACAGAYRHFSAAHHFQALPDVRQRAMRRIGGGRLKSRTVVLHDNFNTGICRPRLN